MPINTKLILSDNVNHIDSLDLPQHYKDISFDYVSNIPVSEICIKYSIGKSRLHYILRYTARTIDSLNTNDTSLQ